MLHLRGRVCSCFLLLFRKSCGTSRWRVCYQQGLPRLVSLLSAYSNIDPLPPQIQQRGHQTTWRKNVIMRVSSTGAGSSSLWQSQYRDSNIVCLSSNLQELFFFSAQQSCNPYPCVLYNLEMKKAVLCIGYLQASRLKVYLPNTSTRGFDGF